MVSSAWPTYRITNSNNGTAEENKEISVSKYSESLTQPNSINRPTFATAYIISAFKIETPCPRHTTPNLSSQQI